jgi:hypothetical protein
MIKKKTKILSVLSFIVSMGLASAAFSADYYVDPAGSNTSGNGSQTSPWQTPSFACSKVTSAGNTIRINAGTYTDNSTCKLAAGVNLIGAGKASVTIKTAYAGSIGTGYIYRQTTPTVPLAHGNNEIAGFTLDGSGKTLTTGIFIRGSDNLNIHDIKFQNIKSNAMIIQGYYDWANKTTNQPPAYGLNNVIHDIETYDTTTVSDLGWGARLGSITLGALADTQVYNLTINENFASRGTGVKAVAGWLKNFKGYKWNVRTDVTNGDAFVFEMYNFCGDSEIYDSTFYHALSLNSGLQTPLAGSTWNLKIHNTVTDFTGFAKSALGHELSHNYLDFYNNYIFGNKGRGAGLWTTNYLTASSVAHWRFRNNVVYNCAAGGVTIERGTLSSIEIYNNVFDTISNSPYGGYGVSTEGFSGTLSGLKIQNNVFTNCMGAPVYITGNLTSTLIDHNLFYGNGNGNAVKNTASGTTTSNNITSTPGLSKTGNKPSPYYVPASGTSNLIDAGVNVGLPYGGKAPDLGAFELQFPSAPTSLAVTQQ